LIPSLLGYKATTGAEAEISGVEKDVYKAKAYPGFTCILRKKHVNDSHDQLLVCSRRSQEEELLGSSRHVLSIMPMQKVCFC
jgi:hypothetical protein